VTADAIARGLASSDPEERRHAASRLVECSAEEAIGFMPRALGDDDWRVRKEATAAAAAMSPSPELLRALVGCLLPSENVGLRNAAVEALASHGPASVGLLGEALGQLDPDGRKLAAEARFAWMRRCRCSKAVWTRVTASSRSRRSMG
jgi:hypothetical protein